MKARKEDIHFYDGTRIIAWGPKINEEFIGKSIMYDVTGSDCPWTGKLIASLEGEGAFDVLWNYQDELLDQGDRRSLKVEICCEGWGQ